MVALLYASQAIGFVFPPPARRLKDLCPFVVMGVPFCFSQSLAMEAKLASNLKSFCLNIPRAEITDLHHQPQILLSIEICIKTGITCAF